MSSRGRSRRAPAVSSTQPFLGNAIKGPISVAVTGFFSWSLSPMRTLLKRSSPSPTPQSRTQILRESYAQWSRASEVALAAVLLDLGDVPTNGSPTLDLAFIVRTAPS
jgi:hypothetical protein